MSLEDRLREIERQVQDLEAELSQPEITADPDQLKHKNRSCYK